MSDESFEKLCGALRPDMQKNFTRFSDPVSVEKQVAATLYYLAEEGRMRKVSNVFGIGKSTISKVIRRVTQAITQYPGNGYIVLPTNQKELENMVSDLYSALPFHRVLVWWMVHMLVLKRRRTMPVVTSTGKGIIH